MESLNAPEQSAVPKTPPLQLPWRKCGVCHKIVPLAEYVHVVDVEQMMMMGMCPACREGAVSSYAARDQDA